MTGTIDTCGASPERARNNFALLMAHVAELYCGGGSSSISSLEANELAMSVAYVLGIADATPEEAVRVLDVDNPVDLWRGRLRALDARVEAALLMRNEVMSTMPPIRNVSLRDTLTSLGELKALYDTYFAAHVVPCDIDYQLSEPVDPALMGIDYVEAWLKQLLREARWIARFEANSCIDVLERICPDYRGLHVNLYDLLFPHACELRLASRR